MIPPSRRVSVNTDLVAGEVVDGEAVIINLSNGMYYTMDKVGAEIWQLIEGRRSVSDMADDIAMRYSVERQTVVEDLERIISELMGEALVIEEESIADEGTEPSAPVHPAAMPYAKPELVRYTDMSDVLALDPPLPELGLRGGKR